MIAFPVSSLHNFSMLNCSIQIYLTIFYVKNLFYVSLKDFIK